MNRQKVATALQARGVRLPCPRCGNNKFTVLDGYAQYMIQPEITGGLVIGGPTVPVALVACENCGAITPHALGALGLLPAESKEAKSDG